LAEVCYLHFRIKKIALKVGILGGGQLGKMLLQAAANYPVETFLLENDQDCPAAHLCHHFSTGDIRSFDDVYNFGNGLHAITIEIESVNEAALEKLEAEGVKIYPRPAALKIIKNKISQKKFYQEQEIPTAPFKITHNLEELKQFSDFIPAVHKIGMGGYDGRGVQMLKSEKDLDKGFKEPAVLEKVISIDKEIAHIVAVSEKGETAIYPPVDMVFNPDLNLLDYQISPADIPDQMLWRTEAIAIKAAKNLKSPGIFAIELFVDKKGDVFVNETAPRVHNSGHHTIEASYCSQFDMLWRIILGYPLGNPESIVSSATVNILGADGYHGDAQYEGLNEVLQMDDVFIHIYGKKQTRPGRKMGHATILNKDKIDLVRKAHKIKELLKVISE
jgi:5-(carboxyamino)imidazole ribonucleotide synthase